MTCLFLLQNGFIHILFNLGVQLLNVAFCVPGNLIVFGKHDFDTCEPSGQSPFTAKVGPCQKDIIAQVFSHKPEENKEQLAGHFHQRLRQPQDGP